MGAEPLRSASSADGALCCRRATRPLLTCEHRNRGCVSGTLSSNLGRLQSRNSIGAARPTDIDAQCRSCIIIITDAGSSACRGDCEGQWANKTAGRRAHHHCEMISRCSVRDVSLCSLRVLNKRASVKGRLAGGWRVPAVGLITLWSARRRAPAREARAATTVMIPALLSASGSAREFQ